MNIGTITNHIAFNSIFSACRDETTGKINWLKVVSLHDLPDDFIMKYFHQLHKFNLEYRHKLSEDVLEKYRDFINWPMQLKFHSLSEESIEKNYSFLKSKGLLGHVLAYGKYSSQFVENHTEDILKWPNYSSGIKMNFHLSKEDTQDIFIFLQKYWAEHPEEIS